MIPSEVSLRDKLVIDAYNKRIPLTGQFELTARCNLRCKMCYLCRSHTDKDAKAMELSAKDWILLAQEAREVGMLYLLLTGGEIFLRQDFKLIYEEINQMGFIVELFTNGTLITSEQAKWLGQIPPSSLAVTLYGGSVDTYHRVCGDGDAFNRAIRGIDHLMGAGVPVRLKTTVIRENYEDYNKISEIADERDIALGIVNYIAPRREGEGDNGFCSRLTAKELIEYDQRIAGYNPGMMEKHEDLHEEKSVEENVHIINQEVRNDLLKYHLEEEDPFGCSAGKREFWITWDGFMTPCGLMREPNTKPLEEGFHKAWDQLGEKCNKIPKCGDCMNCIWKDQCITCPARLKLETGFYDKKAPYLCGLAREFSVHYN